MAGQRKFFLVTTIPTHAPPIFPIPAYIRKYRNRPQHTTTAPSHWMHSCKVWQPTCPPPSSSPVSLPIVGEARGLNRKCIGKTELARDTQHPRTTFDGLQQPLPFFYFCNHWPARDNSRQPHSSPSFMLHKTLNSLSLFSHLYYPLADVGGLIQTLPSSHSCHSTDHEISRQYSPFPPSTLQSP